MSLENIIIMGHSGSGKSVLTARLTEELGLRRVRTTTTRPQREGESDKEYIFSSPFDVARSRKDLLAVRDYNTLIGGSPITHTYGISMDQYKQGGIVILDLEGLESIRYIPPFQPLNTLIIYLDVDKDILKQRASGRQGFEEDEWERRFNTDCKTLSLETIYAFNKDNAGPFKVSATDFRRRSYFINVIEANGSLDETVQSVKDLIKEIF